MNSSTLFLMFQHAAAGTYHAAITENADDFRGKVVMDVGAGSGILSLFAAQAPLLTLSIQTNIMTML